MKLVISFLNLYTYRAHLFAQEDLTVKDTEEILTDLQNDKKPPAGPR